MTENRKRKNGHMHPAVAEEFRKIVSKLDRIQKNNRRLAFELKDEKRALDMLERQEIHINSMPGKQIPFKYQIEIPLPSGTDEAVTGFVNVSKDGPFVCRRIYASVIITDAPRLVFDNGFIRDYTGSIGRYAPVTSSSLYHDWNQPNIILTGSSLFSNFSFFPPLDFEWKYDDSGSKRNRQDKLISGDVLNRADDDGLLMNNDIFAAGSTIEFTVSPTREVTIITSQINGEVQTGEVDIELQVTFDGFKVLQPLEM